jgi:glutamate synthase domain-containing protein 1
MTTRASRENGLYDPQFEHDSCGIGFVANLNGQKSHGIVASAITVLNNMSHRGALGSEPDTGDGAGVLTQIPDKFFREACEKLHIHLPAPGDYAVGMLFLPQDEKERSFCESFLLQIIDEEGQRFLGWRDVPVVADELGRTARNSMPCHSTNIHRKRIRCRRQCSFRTKTFRHSALGKRTDHTRASAFKRTVLFRKPFYPDGRL